MKLDAWLRSATERLAAADIASAQLDALLLLEDQTHKSRAQLLAHPELELSQATIRQLEKKLVRRLRYEPMAYIRGFTEFYGRRFKVNRRVLEPRPESETMIELLVELKPRQRRNLTIADIGCGSGALGITAALELNNHQVDLYDIDSSALAVARHNALLHELHLHAYKRDLLNRPVRDYGIILANLPYVPNTWRINQPAAMEPRIAIFGGHDGLDLYRRLFQQLGAHKNKPRLVFTESLPPQQAELAVIARDAGYRLLKSQDLIQVFGS